MTKDDRISLAMLLIQTYGTKRFMSDKKISRQAVHAWTVRGLPKNYIKEYLELLNKDGVLGNEY